jgi:hypothetical protein
MLPIQKNLFEPSMDVVGSTGSKNGFRDSAFTSNKELPLHRWVPWIAGFSAEFVEDCLNKYLPDGRKNSAWVLDPFVGVGTTLVESLTHGLNVVGFEINPYANLAARMKLDAVKLSAERIAEQIATFESFMEQHCSYNSDSKAVPHSKAPIGFSGRMQLFSPKIERKLLFVLDFINSTEESQIRDIFRLAVGSVMVSISNYSYEPSLTRRSAVGKANIEDAPVKEIISGKVRLMLKDILWLQERMKGFEPKPQARVIAGSIFSAPDALGKTGFVDLVITSPPYLNNYHYPRNTRPQLHWLGWASGSGYKSAREDESFGKFWQSVRTLPPIQLSFRHPELEEIIEDIRRLNTQKGSYGGPGWANYVATYFNDTYRFCRILSSLLRHNGTAIIVLGNSIIQGVEVKTDYFFGKIAELSGLKFEDTLLLRKKRTGSSIIQSSVRVDKAAQRVVLYESGIILRK